MSCRRNYTTHRNIIDIYEERKKKEGKRKEEGERQRVTTRHGSCIFSKVILPCDVRCDKQEILRIRLRIHTFVNILFCLSAVCDEINSMSELIHEDIYNWPPLSFSPPSSSLLSLVSFLLSLFPFLPLFLSLLSLSLFCVVLTFYWYSFQVYIDGIRIQMSPICN